MPSTVFRRGDAWCARAVIRGESVWLGSHVSEEDARAAVSAARMGALSAESVGSWFERWPRLALGVRQRSPATIEHTVARSRPFVDRFGRRPLTLLARSELVAWSIESPSSLRYARTVLADAVWAGVLESNPLSGIRSSAVELRVDPPTVADVERLVARAWAFGLPGAMIGIAAYSGLRLSEVAALEARDVLLGGRRLSVRCGKGGKARVSLLFRPELAAEVPFRRPISRRAWDRRAINRCWVRLRDDVGLPECRFHDLRHFHATWLWDAGVAPHDIAAQLGHADGGELVRRRYGHPSADAALGRVEEVMGRACAA